MARSALLLPLALAAGFAAAPAHASDIGNSTLRMIWFSVIPWPRSWTSITKPPAMRRTARHTSSAFDPDSCAFLRRLMSACSICATSKLMWAPRSVVAWWNGQ